MLMFLFFLPSILSISLQVPCPPLTFFSSLIHQTVLLKKRTHVYHLAVKVNIFSFIYITSFKLFVSQSTARNTRKHKSLYTAILTLSTHDVLDIFYSSLFNVLNVGWTFKLIKTKRMKNNELHSQCTVSKCTNREKGLEEIF